MKKNGSILLVVLTVSFCTVSAQQLPLYNQYISNPYLINPAVAGSDGYTSFFLTARNQWLGFNQAPSTQTFSAQTRLLKRSFIIKRTSPRKRSVFKPSRSGRVGLGGMVFNDRNGLIRRTGFNASYAYHIRMRETQLSFGLRGDFYQMRLDEEGLTFRNPNEPLLGTGLGRSLFIPDATMGVYLMGYEYYAGISVSQIFQSYLKLGNQAFSNYRMLRHYYIMGGYRFFINPDFEIEPSVLVKTTEQLLVQADLNVKFYYLKNYWAGLTLRSNMAFVAMFGLKADKYYFGYSFDYSFTGISRRTYGSHEIMIALKLGDSARRYRWIERY